MTVAFWKWVASRKAGKNARGDLIRDVRDLLSWGMDPAGRIFILHDDGKREYEKLRREYLRHRQKKEKGA